MSTQATIYYRRYAPALIAAAGVAILLLSIGAILVRVEDGWAQSGLVARLLIAAGLVEMAAGSVRKDNYVTAMLAGGVTFLAGLVFTLDPASYFAPASYVLAVWLALRSMILFASGLSARGRTKIWAWLAAATDLALALMVLVSLTALTLPIFLFGPSPMAIGGFGGILAMSFVVTGLYLLEVAGTETNSRP